LSILNQSTENSLKKKRKQGNKKIGLAPGSVVYTGDKISEKLNIEIFDFDQVELVEKESNLIEDVLKLENEHKVTWININGLNHTEEIKKLGDYYKLHSLLIEEIVNVSQRTKTDDYGDYIFVVCKMPHFKDGQLVVEHISFVLGTTFLLSFQEIDGDLFEPIRDRIRNSKGIVRSRSNDYLLFALLDVIVDNYSLIVDEISYKSEMIEEQLLSGISSDKIQADIQELKKEVLRIRKAVYPLKDVINKLGKSEKVVSDKSRIYFTDVLDNITQILENIDLNRELVWGLMDMHLNSLSNKMNEVMKVLTVIATIFIPLTFIAGIYGMNFEFMPELKFKYGYPILMLLMFLSLIVMIFFFRKKKLL